MKLPDFSQLNPNERRQFLKLLTGLIALPALPSVVRDSLIEAVVGAQAHAQAATPINFIEINFRDQWDFGSLFVPPSVARSYDSIRGQIALFETPIQERANFYVTSQAAELRPHLDSIAVMELGECVLPGDQSIHGHEAGNPLRSPGRTKISGGSRIDMATVDRRPGTGGNEILYSSTPTPLVLHNYYQKTRTPGLRNGLLMRSSIRQGTHTFYHFEGNLANAQVDRFYDRTTFNQNFASQPAPVQTSLQRHGALISGFLKRIDDGYLKRTAASIAKQTKHDSNLTALGGLFTTPPVPASVVLNNTELANWGRDIPAQVICPGDDAETCAVTNNSWNPGEIFGLATKLLTTGTVRSVGIDFDMHDIHTNRTPFVMNTQGAQCGRTLARMITELKAANLWNHTIIAMYTLDGSRSPISSSTGENTKNAVILAGGAIRGGYYGDVRVATNGTVTYFRPDDAGNPVATGNTGRDGRVAAADVYKTVATAAGIPESVVNTFPDAAPGRVLRYMLR